METLNAGGEGVGQSSATTSLFFKNIVPSKQDNRSAQIMLRLWIPVG